MNLIPLLAYGALTGFTIKVVIVIVAVCVITWVATKFLGPPDLPQPAKWVVWLIVIIGVLALVFYAFGVPLP